MRCKRVVMTTLPLGHLGHTGLDRIEVILGNVADFPESLSLDGFAKTQHDFVQEHFFDGSLLCLAHISIEHVRKRGILLFALFPMNFR